jgi:predicted dehydrogenase
LRVGVIGVGYFGRFHAAKYAALARCDLVAVVDIDPERAQAAADSYGGTPYTRMDDMLHLVDAVSVATPTSTHFEVASTCLERGVHVLLEKPMTSTLEQADALIALAQEHGMILQVGHQERFFAAQVGLSEIASAPSEIHCARLGPFTGRSVDCSVVTDLMIHDIDLAQSLVRAQITGVIGLGTPSVTNHPDEADVTLYYANGCNVRLVASRASEGRQRTARIVQADGTIEVDFLARTCTHSRLGPIEPKLPFVNGSLANRRALINDNLGQELAAFLDTLRYGGKPMVTGEDGRRALETALMIEENLNPVLAAQSAGAAE